MKGIYITIVNILMQLLQSPFVSSQQSQYEFDRNYGGRRQDDLQGQFVNVEQQQQQQQQAQTEEANDSPVPVVITGLKKVTEYSFLNNLIF